MCSFFKKVWTILHPPLRPLKLSLIYLMRSSLRDKIPPNNTAKYMMRENKTEVQCRIHI